MDYFKSFGIPLHDDPIKKPQYYTKSIYLYQVLCEPISSYINMFLLSSNGLFNGFKGFQITDVFISDLEKA